jgi:superfamily II DNA or RNA helicase
VNIRPYQTKNINEILACLQRGVRGTLYALPTGGGKTVVACQGMRQALAMGWPVLMLVHRRELLAQALKALAKLGIMAGIVDPDHAPDPSRLIHVASIDTLKARAKRPEVAAWLATIKLVVIDEAHHVVADGWRALLDGPLAGAQRLGLTATPYRGDGKPLGDLFGIVVQGPSVAELTIAGFLAPAEVWAPVGAVNLDGVKKSRGDYVASDLEQVMNTDAVTRLAIGQYALKMPGEPAIAFCTTVEHARAVAAAFGADGWRALSVDGGMSVAERDAAIQGLAQGRIQILTSCMIVSEGTDLPKVSGAILLNPTQSVLKHQQQLGRVLRTNPGKTRACIIDLSDNVKRHGMPDVVRRWSLRSGIIDDPAAIKTLRCPACHRRHAPAERCPGCGRAYRAADHRPVGAQLSFADLSDADLRTRKLDLLERLARSRDDLIRIQSARGYDAGWVSHANRRLTQRLSAAAVGSIRRFG